VLRSGGEEATMARRKKVTMADRLERFAQAATTFTGSTTAFLLAVAGLVLWGVTGPIFDYSEVWQLVINTSTTIITFLMVFLIQRSQNKESLAIQLKLNEIVAAVPGASNRLVSVEDLSEEELETLRAHFRTLAQLAKRDGSLKESHSIEDAEWRHESKSKAARKK
jgi:low affinity Fe/Cu permease